LTGVLFGLAPALRTMRVNLTSSLKEGGRSVGEGVQRNITRSILIVAESAVAVILLIGAGLLIRSLVKLQHTSPGFDSNNVLTMRLDLPDIKYPSEEKTTSFFQQLETRIGGLPGVESTGMITELPLSGQPNDIPYYVDGRPPESQSLGGDFRFVNTQYFQSLRIPLLRGRNFTEAEVLKSEKVIIISDLLAKEAFPNEDPLGHRLAMGMGDLGFFEIVGVVGDIRHRELESEPIPTMYMPSLRRNWMNLVIRAQGDPGYLAAAVRKEVKGIDPDQPVASVKPMDEWLAISVSSHRYRTLLLALFAVIALILASTGIYGVMAYSVTQRTHEIGVRMALGARRFDVLKLVVQQGMLLVVIGLVLGIFGAIALTRVMSSVLYEITPKDPVTFVAVAIFLPVVALIACYIPARRATKVDPLVALRYE
jgi:putative ABC transport system permease protein